MKKGTDMNCRLVHNQLIGYIENSLPEVIQDEIKSHIASCGSCNALVQNVSETYFVTEKVAKPQLDPFFSARVIAQYKNREVEQSDVTHRIFRVIQPVAASLILFLGISAGIYLGKDFANRKMDTSSSVTVDQIESYSSEYPVVFGDHDLAVLLDNE